MLRFSFLTMTMWTGFLLLLNKNDMINIDLIATMRMTRLPWLFLDFIMHRYFWMWSTNNRNRLFDMFIFPMWVWCWSTRKDFIVIRGLRCTCTVINSIDWRAKSFITLWLSHSNTIWKKGISWSFQTSNWLRTKVILHFCNYLFSGEGVSMKLSVWWCVVNQWMCDSTI